MKGFSLCCSGSQSAGPRASSITWELVRNVDSLASFQIVNLAPLDVGPASALPSPPVILMQAEKHVSIRNPQNAEYLRNA